MESRTQGSRPRPRTQKNFEAKDKPSRGQGQTLSRPRPKDAGASVLKKRFLKIFLSSLKKKVFKNFFQAKKVFKNFFSGDFHLRKTKKGLRKFSARFLALSNKLSTVQKIVLSSSRGQGNFRGLEASRPMLRPRTSKSVPMPRTSLRIPPLKLTLFIVCVFSFHLLEHRIRLIPHRTS